MDENRLYQKLLEQHIPPATAETATLVITVTLVLVGVIITSIIIRRSLLYLCLTWVKKNKSRWQPPLLENQVFSKLSWFIPIIILHFLVEALLPGEGSVQLLFERVMKVFFVFVTVVSSTAILTTTNDIFRLYRTKRADMLKGFVEGGKIVLYIIGIIFVVSILSGVSPWGILSVLGGLTAVTILVFKDTILGFVASIQLTTMDMIRIGDWLEMPDYGADGDVISMSIHTVKVQNWDKTITTIPTYALVSNSFKNWRGMSESGGRRIKRALMIDVNSIRFCDAHLLDRLRRIPLLTDYLDTKEREITAYNKAHNLENDDEIPINGRRQTNIGVFRAYVGAYLKNNPHINENMTFLVRHLTPTEYGLPLQVYVFSRDKRWPFYEAIQADIFDHLFAALATFELRAFQSPSGFDMRHMLGGNGSDSK